MKYLKKFSNHSDYNTFTGSTEFIKPNVSHCIQENDVHYNPKEDEPTNNKLTASYNDGTSRTVECNGEGELTSGETKPSGYQASAMTTAVIGDCVTEIGEFAFSECSSLTSVTIPNTVTSIGMLAFYYCSGLTSVNIPSGVTSIGSNAFFACIGPISLTVNPVVPPTLGDLVFTATNIYPIYVPAESVEAYKSAEGWSQYSDRIFPIE